MLVLVLALACSPSSPDNAADSGGAGGDTGLTSACDEVPSGQVQLPADDAIHEEAVEWWYWTGHLVDDQGGRYGFEQAVFAFQMGAYVATSAHVAVTDIEGGRFLYDVAYVHGEVPAAVPDGFELVAEGDSASGGGGSDTLVGSVPGDDGGELAGFSLSLVDAKAPVLQHGDGYHDYDIGGYTWYYSRPRMDVTGTLSLDGDARAVTGTAWFDHQWGDLLSISDAGWDWFALQLDDGREIMLFMVKGAGDLVGGSVTDAGCHTTELSADDVEITPSEEWTSAATGCVYPQRWTVRVGDEQFEVASVLPEQELANDYQTYWEGAATVDGDATGRAYIELAGQCN